MTVTTVRKDSHRLTMTIEAEFDASPERVWQLWADPRQLERWWGPPNYPATVTRHNLAPGGRVEYGMIGPQGDRHRGYWEILEAEAPRRLVFRDGLAGADGTPNTDMPLATTRVTIEELRRRQQRHEQQFRVTARQLAEFLASLEVDEVVLEQRLRDVEARSVLEPLVANPALDTNVVTVLKAVDVAEAELESEVEVIAAPTDGSTDGALVIYKDY